MDMFQDLNVGNYCLLMHHYFRYGKFQSMPSKWAKYSFNSISARIDSIPLLKKYSFSEILMIYHDLNISKQHQLLGLSN